MKFKTAFQTKSTKSTRIAGMLMSAMLISAINAPSQALARTDIKAKQQQLQENLAASKSNLEQYEANLKTVLSNLAETEKSLKTIEKQRLSIAGQTKQAGKDQQTVAQAQSEVESLMKAERDKLEAEDKQVEELKATLQRLENNREKRRENIAAYEERLKRVQSDKGQSDERTQSVGELELALKAKEDEARTERKKLLAKKSEYEEEIAKWKKQVRTSERAAANFSKLKEQ